MPLLVATLLVFSTVPAAAHPGNTDSDGCHYCRTNCASWGVPQDAKHCHGGTTSVPRSEGSGSNHSPRPATSPQPLSSNGGGWVFVPWLLFWGSIGGYFWYRRSKRA